MVRRVVLLCVVFAVLHTGQGAVDEEDSDVEYDKSISVNPTKKVFKPRVRVESEDDDDLGQIKPSTDSNEQSAEPEKKHTPMLPRWQTQTTFWVEGAFVGWLVLAVFVYFRGKSENSKFVQSWLRNHIDFLETQFTLVGDDGNFNDKSEHPRLIRESPSMFRFYCSGRRGCAAVLFTFELCARQDIFARIWNTIFQSSDEMTMLVELDERDKPAPFALAMIPNARHKSYIDDHADLKQTRNITQKFQHLPDSMVLFSDCEGAAVQVMSADVRKMLMLNQKLFKSIHITDNNPFGYSKKKRVVRIQLRMPHSHTDESLSLLRTIFHVIDRINDVKLSEKDVKEVNSMREAALVEQKKLEQQQLQEEVARKKLEQRRKEREQLEKRIEEATPENRRKLEQKLQQLQDGKKKLKKQKMQFVSI